MDSRPIATSLAWFLILALLFHVCFFWLPLPRGGGPGSLFSSKKKDKEFVLERAPDLTNDKQVVQTNRSDEDNYEKAHYSGEHRNRVKKETQTSRRGKFSEGRVLHPNSGSGNQITNGEDVPRKKGGDPSNAAGLAMRDLMAYSSSPNALDKDVANGDETMLNTDQVLYASFFNRLADEIYDPWVSHLRDYLHDRDFNGRRLPPKTYVTRLNIYLNQAGTVTAISVLESSGVPELDDAAKKAFWEREPFLNPPEQMFGRDGLMHFVYGFQVDYRSSFFNIMPWST